MRIALLALMLAACGGASQTVGTTPPPCAAPTYDQPPWDQGMSPPPEPMAQGDSPTGCHDDPQD